MSNHLQSTVLSLCVVSIDIVIKLWGSPVGNTAFGLAAPPSTVTVTVVAGEHSNGVVAAKAANKRAVIYTDFFMFRMILGNEVEFNV